MTKKLPIPLIQNDSVLKILEVGLHRGRVMLRDNVERKIGPVAMEAFPFAGRRCDRLTAAVLNRLGYA